MCMKRLLLVLVGCALSQVSISQNDRGFIPDSCAYMVIAHPSRTTQYSRLVYGCNFRYPFLMADGTMLLLSDDDVETPMGFELPFEIQNPDESFVVGRMLLCRYGNAIKTYDGKKVEKIWERQNEKFKIYPANGEAFYYVTQERDSSSVFMFDLVDEKLVKLFDVPFQIDRLAGSGQECFVTMGEKVYFVSDEIFTLVAVADSRVQSIDFFSDGAFYSTEKACYYIGLPGKSYPFLLGDIKQLMLVDNRLYLLFRDGLLSVIDNASQYQRLLDKVVNKTNEQKDEEQ